MSLIRDFLSPSVWLFPTAGAFGFGVFVAGCWGGGDGVLVTEDLHVTMT